MDIYDKSVQDRYLEEYSDAIKNYYNIRDDNQSQEKARELLTIKLNMFNEKKMEKNVEIYQKLIIYIENIFESQEKDKKTNEE